MIKGISAILLVIVMFVALFLLCYQQMSADAAMISTFQQHTSNLENRVFNLEQKVIKLQEILERRAPAREWWREPTKEWWKE